MMIWPSGLIAEDKIPVEYQPKLTVQQMVTKYAKENGVDLKLANFIVSRESHYNPNEVGDLDIKCNNPGTPYHGKPVYARGLMQITRCYYPEISDEQAFDPEFNLKFGMALVGKSRKSCVSQFSTCAQYYREI